MSCSLSNTALTNYRGGFDFSTVQTYSTYDRNSSFAELQNISDTTRNSIEIAIEQVFDRNGFEFNTVTKADIVIAYHVVTHEIGDLQQYNKGVKYCGYCLKATQVSRKQLEKKFVPGSLIIDIINPSNSSSVWRSVYPLKIKEKDNSREVQEKIYNAIDVMLKDYPNNKLVGLGDLVEVYV
jgi:hypothetical protein